MLELMRQILLAGLGAGVITKEKAKEAVSELVEQGRLTVEEAERLVERLVESGGQQWEDTRTDFRQLLSRAAETATVARRSDLDELGARLRNVEQRLTMLENTVARGKGEVGP